MSFRDRVLPPWLINLESGNTPSKKKTECNKSHGNKKHVNVHNDNVNHASADENENLPSTSKIIDNSVMVDRQTKTKLSPIKQARKPPRANPEMSSSEEEVEVKPDITSLSEYIPEADSTVDSQLPLVSSIKKEEDDATDIELDPNIKRESNKGSVCKEGQESRGIESNNNDKSTENDDRNICDAGSDTGGPIGSNADAGSGDDILVSVNADCDAGTSIDAAISVNSAGGDQSDSVSSTTDSTNKIDRSKCKYGAQCYRKNPQHLQDFSHPGDSDYSTIDNRPECQYGLACYRKNPLHRQHYKHTKMVQRPRKAKRQKKKLVDDSASDEDDYDLDDSFIDDGSSDDYKPSDSDSETDFEEGGEAESDDNAEQDVNDSKKIKRKRRH
ncbi:Aprataxin and PNK-like factor [Gryllus bimaculatus]|nr:Aprataxin and PNK-like factor [Gryllus bimaculatus]